MFSKPVTGSLAPSVVNVILCGSPMFAEEHLVHAWDAIGAALRASERDDRAKVEQNIGYARRRLEQAIDTAPRSKPRNQAAVRAECESLRLAIEDAVRYF